MSNEDKGLDYALAKWMIPRLRRFKKMRNGHPGRLTTIEGEAITYLNDNEDESRRISAECDRILDEIEWGLCYTIDEPLAPTMQETLANEKRRDRAWELLGKNIGWMWI